MSGVGPAWRSRAAQALLGPDRSPLVPSMLWVGWLDEANALIGMSGTSVASSSFAPLGDGVTNVAVVDGGVAGSGWSIAAVGLFDAPAGDLVVYALLPAVLSPAEGEPLSMAVGALVFTAA